MYYIKKVPEANKRESHNSLGAELKILLALLPEKELKYQCACNLKERLKVKFYFLLAHLHKSHPCARWPSDFVTEGNRFVCPKWSDDVVHVQMKPHPLRPLAE